MCQKPHPEKNRFDWKSQGQIIQECVECQKCQECQGQISQGQMGNHKKPEKTGFNWKNRKNGK